MSNTNNSKSGGIIYICEDSDEWFTPCKIKFLIPTHMYINPHVYFDIQILTGWCHQNQLIINHSECGPIVVVNRDPCACMLYRNRKSSECSFMPSHKQDSRDNKRHSYKCSPIPYFQVTGLLWKICRDASRLLLSLLLLFVYVWPYHPLAYLHPPFIIYLFV